MIKAFLSHNFLDKPFVRLFGEDLEAAGIYVWFDEANLRVGDSLPREIASAISDTDYVLAFLSRNSLGSSWVRKELDVAMTLEINGEPIKILPLRLDDSKLPTLLVDKYYADFAKAGRYNSEFRKVLKRIDPTAVPDQDYSFYCLTIGATRKDRLVRAAKEPSMREWVLDYLTVSSAGSSRPTERHFAYLALGEIGGESAEAEVRKGLSDENEFARGGAQKAWTMLGH